MYACVGDLAEPGPRSCIGGIAIDLESFGPELTCQRNVEASTQVGDEAFDLALCLRPIRSAQSRQESVMVREVEEGAIISM